MSALMAHATIEQMAFKLQKELTPYLGADFNHVWLAYLAMRDENRKLCHILSCIDGTTVMKASEMAGYGNQIMCNQNGNEDIGCIDAQEKANA